MGVVVIIRVTNDVMTSYSSMASSLHTDVVREAITAAIRKTPSQSSRAVKLKQLGNTILKKIDDQECEFAASFDKFSLELVSYLRGKVRSEASRYKATSSKRQKLWSVFHNLLTNTLQKINR